MRGFTGKLGVIAAGLALSAIPVLAGQRPSDSSPTPAESRGTAVERPSAGGGGGGGGAATAGAANTGGGSTSSSPSAGAASSPSFSSGERSAPVAAEPQHRSGGSSGGGSRGNSGGGSGERATPRGSGSSANTGTTHPSGSASRDGGTGSSNGTATTRNAAERDPGHAAGDNQVPSWSRPRGDRPSRGTAVDRSTLPPGQGGTIIIGGGYYNPYFPPYGFYPGFGLGLGFGFYDPWYDPWFGGYGAYGGYGGGSGYGGGGYYPYTSGAQDPRYSSEGEGAVRLKVKPRDAKVYVDGYFVGTVDSFDGAFQKLSLGGGHHRVEVKADGYDTAQFDVLITPGQTVTYQGDLKRIQ
jgi:hypothetical protein